MADPLSPDLPAAECEKLTLELLPVDPACDALDVARSPALDARQDDPVAVHEHVEAQLLVGDHRLDEAVERALPRQRSELRVVLVLTWQGCLSLACCGSHEH